ncbi:hypothetical protein K466DRAFT_606454 [Polyporus arcularius HHB13444]|uniref:Uncharacterized protein n=1 Tax=Polyporus arcularius HHB13444 TaxID=1314778 RepID=A0A5C3NRN0_9APHY|nr:hypothetical protein K466DRAFT_606454 [Polyporus arcularius HHB13444]
MARTKQTTRRSTGKSAPRAPLGSKVKPEAAKNSGSKRANKESPSKLAAKRSKWCSLCQNGGDTIECNLCKRIACKHHFPAIVKLSQGELDPLVFKCTSCEVLEQRKVKAHGGYKGLYKIEDGKESERMRANSQMRMQRVVCFGAAALQVPLTVPFFMGFAISVYIEGVNLDHSHFTRLLSSASMLNHHTTVVLYTRVAANQPVLLLNNYRWSHHTVWPYGEELPLQCPDCSLLASLKIKAGQGDKLHGTCEQKGCGFSCAYALSEGYKVVKAIEQGAWLVSVETVGK